MSDQLEMDLGELLVKKGTSIGLGLIRPSSMYESLRYAEYDVASGIGEIVDNGIEANATEINIITKSEKRKIGVRTTDVISEIAIIDNGIGMTEEIQRRCLVLGDSVRAPKENGLGIGRFGVGLTLGGISLARRIEVYTRNKVQDEFRYNYLDLDLIKFEKQTYVPDPVESDISAEYKNKLENSTGTIIILKNCDRLENTRLDEQIAGLSNFLGRTFRKFIYGGITIKLNDEKVHLHDPLYRLGPTRFDIKNPEQPDIKAAIWGKTGTIELEIPKSRGKMAKVHITMTLLPKEWRKVRGDGNRPFAKERKIDQNEGISILRANREVLYAHVPYLIGKKGQSSAEAIDRWWGCEISFPPELDDYFEVRFIKRGAQPVPFLRDKIRAIISPAVEGLRGQIQNDFKEKVLEKAKASDHFSDIVSIMAEADKKQPKGKLGSNVTLEEQEKEIERIVREQKSDDSKTPEEKKNEIKERPYSIVPVSYPETFLFETVHMIGKVVVKLNVNHPFYKDVFEPLCGSIDEMDEDSDSDKGTLTDEQRIIRQSFMLLLLSYAKAESFFENLDPDVLTNLRTQWGIALANVLKTAEEQN